MEFVSATSEQNVDKCRHFSIRGFVAEVRKKNRKACWPFSCEELVEMLPPMQVPESRYWQCKNCTKHAQDNGEDTALCKRMADACTIIDVNDLMKNTSVCINTDDGPQHAPRESSSQGKITNDLAAGKKKVLCVNIQEKKFAVRKCDNVAVEKFSFFNRPEDEPAAATLNQDKCSSKCHDGTAKEVFTSPRSLDGQRRGKQVIDGRIRKPRTKRPAAKRPNLSTTKLLREKTDSDDGAVEFINLGGPEDEDVDFGTLRSSEEGGCQTSEIENHITRSDGMTGKRKRLKLRTLGSILSRCGEKEAGSSSSESGASLGFDLNLSPTHQIVTKKKMITTGDEDEASIQMSLQNSAPDDEESWQISSENNVPVTIESSADKEQQAKVIDHTVSSWKRKGKVLDRAKGNMFEKENGDSSSLRYPYSDSGTPSRVSREENLPKRNEIVNGKLPLLPEDPTKMPDTPQKLLGQSGKRADPGKSGNDTSGKASSDDIPIEIIELMAKNLYERRMGASEPDKGSAEMPLEKRKVPNTMKNPEALGTELLMFLQEKISQKSKLQFSSKGKAKRLNSADPIQSADHVVQTSDSLGRIKIPPEQVYAFKGFMNQGKASNGPPTFSKNHDPATSQAPHYVGSSSRDFDYQKSVCSLNKEKSSSGAQFLFGPSSSARNFDYQTPKFQQNLDEALPGSHLHVGSSKGTSLHQSSMFSLYHEKPITSTQLLPGSITISDELDRNMYPRTCLQTSEAYQLQSPLSYNSCHDDRHATRPWMTPNCLPFENAIPRKFSVGSNSPSNVPQCLELFPKVNQIPLANTVEDGSRNINFGPNKRIQPKYSFAGRERRVMFNQNSVRPLDLYSKETIPATDLLRLMDAGACPPIALNINNRQKVTQQRSLPSDHCQLEMSSFRQSKNNDAPALPSSSEYFSGKQHTGNFSQKFPSTPAANQASSSVARVHEANGIRSSLQNCGITKINPCLRRSIPAKRRPDFPSDPTKEKAIGKESAQPESLTHKLAPILHQRKQLQSTPASTPSPTDKEKFCSINRNPAEFTVPETENEYMIGYGDVPTVRPALVKEVQHKRQKKVRFAAVEAAELCRNIKSVKLC